MVKLNTGTSCFQAFLQLSIVAPRSRSRRNASQPRPWHAANKARQKEADRGVCVKLSSKGVETPGLLG